MADYISKFTGQQIDAAIQKATDIAKTATDINSNLAYAEGLKTNLNTIADNEIVSKKSDGSLQGTGIINESDKIFFPKDGRFPSASIDIGPAATISENGGWLQYTANTLGEKYILLDYENDETGSKRPIYWERAAEEKGHVVNNVDSTEMDNITTFNYIPTANSQVNALYLNFATDVSNFMAEIVSLNTGKPIKYIPNENAWKTNVGGLNLASGVRNILQNISPISLLTAYNLKINLKANTAINLKGDGTKPYLKVDRQLITAKPIALQGEGGGGSADTAEQIRDKLQSLTSENRLDSTAIKNLPTHQNEIIKYETTTEPVLIEGYSDILYLRFDKEGSSGQTYIQNLPNANTVIGMITYVEFISNEDSKLKINNMDATTITELNGGDKAELHATDTGWIRFDKDISQFINGINVSASNNVYSNIKSVVFPQATATQQEQGIVSIEGIADIDLNNVPAESFNDKLKLSDAYIKVAKKQDKEPSEVKDTFESNYYEETSSVDISQLEGDFLIIKYQITTPNTIIQQTLPPSSTGKIFIMQFYKPANILTGSVEIFPPNGELINGEDKTLVYIKSGLIGLFLPTSGGYEFISKEMLHDNELVFFDKNNKPFTSNVISATGNVIIKNEESLGAVIGYDSEFSPSYLGYCTNSTELVDSFIKTDTQTYTQDIIRPNKEYADRQNTTLKANTYYLLCGRISLLGKSVADGYAKLFFRNKTSGTEITDVNGKSTMYSKNIKINDNYGYIETASIVGFTEDTQIELVVQYSIGEEILTIGSLTEGITGILIHDLSKDLSLGLIKYELDTRQNIIWTTHDYTKPIMDTSKVFDYDQSLKIVAADAYYRQSDNLGLEALTECKYTITNSVLTVQDNGSAAFFDLNYVLTSEDTYVSRGSQIKVDIELENNQSEFVVNFAKWTGQPDKFINKLIVDQDSGNITLTEGWTLLPDTDNITSGTNSKIVTADVPEDSNNIAVIIRPYNKVNPLILKLKSMKVKVLKADNYYTLYAPELLDELHYYKSDQIAQAKMIGELFYYARTHYVFLPMGDFKKGNAPVKFVTAPWSTTGYGGWSGNTNLKFEESGTIRISNLLHVKVGSFADGEDTVTITCAYGKLKNGSTGDTISDYDLIAGTEQTFQVDKTESETDYPLNEISITAEANDEICLMWKSSSTSETSVYVIGKDNTSSSVETLVYFEKSLSENVDIVTINDKINAINGKLEFTENAVNNNMRIKVDCDADGSNPKISVTNEGGII